MESSLKQAPRNAADETAAQLATQAGKSESDLDASIVNFADRFDVKEKIGSGSFGDVKRGIDKLTGAEVAIKLDKKEKGETSSVALEAYFYGKLLMAPCSMAEKSIPRVIFSGLVGKKYVLVMEMLGPNLEKLFDACNRHFSLKTVSQIAIQLLHRIEFIHSKGLLHRDIKPENFVIGRPEEPDAKVRNRLRIMDFGLSKCYLHRETGAHNPPLTGKELTGTARYVSLRTHNGEEQSRRDDIEAIGHMLIYFMRGSLPWQGLKVETQPGLDTRAANKLRYKKIEARKRSISIQELCAGIPWEFERFLSYARYVMGYMDEPDYDYLIQLFSVLREQHGYPDDGLYDWDCLEKENQQNMEQGYQSLSNIKVRGTDASEQKML